MPCLVVGHSLTYHFKVKKNKKHSCCHNRYIVQSEVILLHENNSSYLCILIVFLVLYVFQYRCRIKTVKGREREQAANV